LVIKLFKLSFAYILIENELPAVWGVPIKSKSKWWSPAETVKLFDVPNFESPEAVIKTEGAGVSKVTFPSNTPFTKFIDVGIIFPTDEESINVVFKSEIKLCCESWASILIENGTPETCGLILEKW